MAAAQPALGMCAFPSRSKRARLSARGTVTCCVQGLWASRPSVLSPFCPRASHGARRDRPGQRILVAMASLQVSGWWFWLSGQEWPSHRHRARCLSLEEPWGCDSGRDRPPSSTGRPSLARPSSRRGTPVRVHTGCTVNTG